MKKTFYSNGLRSFYKIAMPFICLATSPLIHAEAAQNSSSAPTDWKLDYFKFEQKMHSSGEGVLAGESTEVDAALKYTPAENSFFRLRFDIDPDRYATVNKTSRLEGLFNHRMETLELQVDMDLDFDSESRGATSIGLDTDSDASFVRYKAFESWDLTIYPYNFDGEVGRVFATDDVTRIYYIDGLPTLITAEKPGNGVITSKTLPGLELRYRPLESLSMGIGYAAARYLYPEGQDFKIEDNVSSETWKSKTDTGYKAHMTYDSRDNFIGDTTKICAEYVTHNGSKETGSLLANASSLQISQSWGAFSLYLEAGQSKAGEAPYRLSSSTKWFSQTTPFEPGYTDFYGKTQDWVGKSDRAEYLKASYAVTDDLTPYISVKKIGPNFVFLEDESAHRLRTADGSQSHGGLQILGLGLGLKSGQYSVTPEVEYKTAKNKVFGDKNSLRSERQLMELNDKETSMTLYVTYQL